MHILLTNDDGIFADGLQALYKKLKTFARVTVVAPDGERSSIGQAITLSKPLRFKQIKIGKTFSGYAVEGTPTDSVKLGLGVILKEKPDMVVSGINRGDNDGCSVFYSGTVAAAREGALCGLPAIALSLATFRQPDFRAAAVCSAGLIQHFLKYPMPKGTFLNVNIPDKKNLSFKDARPTRQCRVPIHTGFKKKTDPNENVYYWMTGKPPVHAHDTTIDTCALKEGFVTITPIHCDTTDYVYLEKLKSRF